MGVCLAACGADFSKLKGLGFCPHHAQKEGHVLLAEQLAKELDNPIFGKMGIGKRQKVKPKGFHETLNGTTGIIFFKDYWQRSLKGGKKEAFRNRSGDHIDLWNGSRLTAVSSWLRIQIGIVIPGEWSDFEESREIWFLSVQ